MCAAWRVGLPVARFELALEAYIASVASRGFSGQGLWL